MITCCLHHRATPVAQRRTGRGPQPGREPFSRRDLAHCLGERSARESRLVTAPGGEIPVRHAARVVHLRLVRPLLEPARDVCAVMPAR
jgi:hypothetical protein